MTIGRRITELVEVVAHGEHVFLARQSSEMTVQDEQQRSAAVVAEPEPCAFVIDEGDVGEHVALADHVSVGVVDAMALLDLDYSEDVRAEVDMNAVMTGTGRFVEVQGTAEGLPFSRAELDDLLGLAEHGIASILDARADVLLTPPPPRS